MSSLFAAVLSPLESVGMGSSCILLGALYVRWKMHSRYRHSLAPDRFFAFAVAMLIGGALMVVVGIGRILNLID